jgi:hypothetical protein
MAPHNEEVVGLGRFELPTSPLSGVRSNQLSYRPGAGIEKVPASRQDFDQESGNLNGSSYRAL